MVSITSLLPKLTADFPSITFSTGEHFLWSPDHQTVYYKADEDGATPLLLHELSHGLLEHHDYQKDIELVAMESAAWQHAQEIAGQYGVTINEDTVQDHLDTYRDWLHARSSCPNCEATGYQVKKSVYRCVACSHEWRVNEARLCALRRYSLS